jgi:ribose transport system permease protein
MSIRISSTFITRFLSRYGSLVMLATLVILMSLTSKEFLSLNNLTNVARQVSIFAIIGTGMTFVIITAGIDLSVGSQLALTGCVAMTIIDKTNGDFIGITAGILVGAICGAANGITVSRFRVPPFIATLAGLTVFRGLSLVITNGLPIIKFEGSFRFIGQGVIAGIPVPVIIMVIVVIVMQLVLSRTAFGAYVYSVGGNEEAARLSGIKVAWVKFWAYVLCGFLSGLSGMILMARLSSAQPAVGEGFELDAIAAVVLGGTSLMGGRGAVWSTLIGAFVIGILSNGMNLMGVHSHYQLVAKGVLIVLAVMLDDYLKRRI